MAAVQTTLAIFQRSRCLGAVRKCARPLPPCVALGLLAAPFLLIGCVQQVSGEQARPPASTDAEKVSGTGESGTSNDREIAIAVAVPADPAAAPRTFAIDTSLMVDDDVTVMARMSGIVEKIMVDRGSRVRKGDLLLQLMNRDLKLQLERAAVDHERKAADYKRIRELFEEKAISASQFDDSRLALESARIEVEIAREELEKSMVRAPFDGVVIDRFAKPGQKVIEDDVPLFRITTLSPLLARLYLPEEIARALQQGDEVEVVPRYVPSVSVKGRIDWLSSVIDASSGTCQAIVSVPGDSDAGDLSPGTAVTLILNLAPVRRVSVLIPRAALDGEDDGPAARQARVKVVESDGESWRRVRLGAMHGESIEILEGLQPGDRVVVRRDAGDGVAASR